MTDSSILLVGRGPSSFDYDWSWDGPIMAVSSGIFAVPEGSASQVTDFVTMDQPKFFLGHGVSQHPNAWGSDEKARSWPFWADPCIVKHVPINRVKPGHYRQIPPEVYDAVPEHLRDKVARAFFESIDQAGYQPGWGDYATVRGWDTRNAEPDFTEGNEGPVGIAAPEGRDPTADPECLLINSLFMAVQVAARLGYRRLCFIGCDMHGEGYARNRLMLRAFYDRATAAGMEWVNLAPSSSLAEYMPTEAPCRT